MDNARIHHYKGLTEVIPNFNIEYLPPYSPFLNPIESIFSVWKLLVISENVNSELELKNVISENVDEITTEHCDSFFRKMLRYVSFAEQKITINE